MARASRPGASGARWVRLAVCAFFAAACGDDGGGGGGPTLEGLQILSGSEQTDTIAAELAKPLVVQVFDAPDHPAEGVEVQIGDRTCDLGCRAFSIAGPGGVSRLETSLETDTAGRVTVLIRLGTIAGPALVPIRVPSLQLVDTARFTVEPGNPETLRSTVGDTAIYADASMTLDTEVLDRAGNPRSESVSYLNLTSSILEVSPDGHVTGRRVGSGRVRMSIGELTAEVAIGVVPPGTIAMSSGPASDPTFLQIVNLDGTGHDTLAPIGILQWGASSWSPDGRTIIYKSLEPDELLRRVPAAGGPSVPLPVAGFPLLDAFAPQYSSDGTWVYFQGATYTGNDVVLGEIWRVHPDGTGYERVGPAGSSNSADLNPTPSPDGTRVAFVSDRGHRSRFTLRVLTIASGAETELALDGLDPRWSPDGTWIALNLISDNAVWVVHPDGSEAHRVTPDNFGNIAGAGLTWSPDGKYLIGVDDLGMVLFDLDGNGVRLPATNGNTVPSWKP